MYNLINDFRLLSAPPTEALVKREEQVKSIIQQMGDKYRLHNLVQRKTK